MSSLRPYSLYDLATVTRGSTAAYCDASGLLRTASADVARIEYDPISRAVRGLLIEGSRTNVILRSQEFSNASWSKSNSTVTADAVAAPDGTTTADKLVEDGATAAHYVQQLYTKASSTEVQAYSASIWVKAAGRSKVQVLCQGTSGSAHSAYAQFDLTSVTASAVTTSGNFDSTSTSIEAWPNGWYRCTLNFRINNDGQASVGLVVMPANASALTNYLGDGSSGLYLWGAQLEKGATATSYIPTTTAAVARAADTMVGTLGQWFDDSVGTIAVEYMLARGNDASSARVIQLDDGTESNRHTVFASNGYSVSLTTAGGVDHASMSRSGVTAGVVQKVAYAYAANDFAMAATGGALQTDTSGSLPAVSTFRIGHAVSGDALNGYVRRIRYYPRRLTNNELTALVA